MLDKVSYEITIVFTEAMLGTVAKDPEIYKTYIESKKPETEKEEEHLNVEKTEEKGWTGFHKNEEGIFIYNYMIKGMLKNAGNILKEQLKIKALRSKITNHIFITPRHVFFTGKTGRKLKKHDSVVERPIQCQTPLGPRVSLARSEAMNEGRTLKFQIELIDHKEIKEKTIRTLLDYGSRCGLGQFRTGGFGSFKVTKFVKVK